ncbi:MAG: ABC transporter permease [Micrococcales bacterium]|nr:MAG: ABC transporter permease [Micrococcales bacterium]PIE26938.1 MAG: ABC transporter permease [Micrococcales bacterium]
MSWLIDNFDTVLGLTGEHVYMGVLPTVIGLVLAVLIGLALRERPLGRRVVTVAASVAFTIPSLALFIVIPAIIATRFLDPRNVVIALSLYSTALMVRVAFDALDAVPEAVRDAATANGFSRWKRAVQVDPVLAIPTLAAGARVVSSTNISMVSVGAVIGVGGLGELFTTGYQRSYPEQIMAGIIAILVLAFVVDRIIAVIAYLATPWQRAGDAADRSPGGGPPASRTGVVTDEAAHVR